VAIPEELVEMGGETVLVRGFTVAGRFGLVEAAASGDLTQPDMYRLALTNVYDPATGERVFTDEAVTALISDAHAPALDAVVAVFARVNGLDTDAEGNSDDGS